MEPHEWRRTLTTAADRAVAALGTLQAATWGDRTGWGADGSVTVAADLAAEEAVLTFLADAVPGAGLCSEEAGVVNAGADILFIVDPLDGTNNAVRGVPYWAVSIAVVVDGTPTGGLVRNVVAGHDFFVWAGLEPTCGDAPISANDTRRLADACVAVQRPIGPDIYERARPILLGAGVLRLLGATALDICYVAAGGLDAYVNVNVAPSLPFGDKVVDYAAAAVIATAAGAVVTDAAGDPAPFTPDLRARVPIVAAATRPLHDELLAALAKAP